MSKLFSKHELISAPTTEQFEDPLEKTEQIPVEHEEYDYIIIGAGFSGIYIASLLKSRGYSIFVIESEDRIGGHIHEVDFGQIKVDLGGKWISKNHTKTLNLAKNYGVKMSRLLFPKVIINNGQNDKYANVIFPRIYKKLLSNIDVIKKNRYSFQEYVIMSLNEVENKIVDRWLNRRDMYTAGTYDIFRHFNEFDWQTFAIPFDGWMELLKKIYSQGNILDSDVTKNSKVVKIEDENNEDIYSTVSGANNIKVEYLQKIDVNGDYNEDNVYKREVRSKKVVWAAGIGPLKNIEFASLDKNIFKQILPMQKTVVWCRHNSVIRSNSMYISLPSKNIHIYILHPNSNISVTIAYGSTANFIGNSMNDLEKREFLFLLNKLLTPLTNISHIIDFAGKKWENGFHQYLPTHFANLGMSNREEMVKNFYPNLSKNVFIVGESVSSHHGWLEGAVETVNNMIEKPQFI